MAAVCQARLEAGPSRQPPWELVQDLPVSPEGHKISYSPDHHRCRLCENWSRASAHKGAPRGPEAAVTRGVCASRDKCCEACLFVCPSAFLSVRQSCMYVNVGACPAQVVASEALVCGRDRLYRKITTISCLILCAYKTCAHKHNSKSLHVHSGTKALVARRRMQRSHTLHGQYIK